MDTRAASEASVMGGHHKSEGTAPEKVRGELAGGGPAEQARLRVFLRVALQVDALFTVMYLAAAFVFRSWELAGVSVVLALALPVGVGARALVTQGRTELAANLTAYAILALTALTAALLPFSVPSLVLLPIVATIASLPYLRRESTRVLLVACLATELVVALTTWFTPPKDLPTWFTGFVFFSSLLASALLVLLLLFQYNARLRETLSRIGASEERFRSLVFATAQVVWTADPRGLIVDDTPSWRELTGQSWEELRGSGWLEAIHPQDRERVAANWAEAVARRTSYEVEFRLRRRDGGYVPMVSRGTPVLNADGSIREWVGICTDISERLESYRALQRALESRDDFLGQVSHELRTPLTPLKLQVQMLRAEASRAPEGAIPYARLAPKLDGIDRQVRQLTELISNLLDVSQLDAGTLRLELEDVDLVVVARETVERYRELLGHARCPCELRGMDAPVVGHWDKRRVAQVLGHLLTNACRYGAGKPITLSVDAGDALVRLSVEDRGVGIDPMDQARIFERFERASSARHYGGMGMGLWICRQITNELGGEISVVSHPDEGSTFTVTLPRQGPVPVAPAR